MIFGIMAVIGGACIALGIWIKNSSKRMQRYGKRVTCTIESCDLIKNYSDDGTLVSEYFDVVYSFYCDGEWIKKRVPGEKQYAVGSYEEFYYLPKNNYFMSAKDIKLNQGRGPGIIVVLGVIFLLMGFFAQWGELLLSEQLRQKVPYLYAIFIGIVFVAVGIFSIANVLRMRKGNFRYIQGTVVDVKKVSGRTSNDMGPFYAPIFAFFDNGIEYKFQSSVSSNTNRWRVGKTVRLLKNDETGQIKEKGEMRSTIMIGLVFGIMGGLVLVAGVLSLF